MSTDQPNQISTVRQYMLDQLKALRDAPAGAALDAEIRRAKGVSDLAQTLINSAKVEVEYLTATGQDKSPFLASADTPRITHEEGKQKGITAVTRHWMQGK